MMNTNDQRKGFSKIKPGSRRDSREAAVQFHYKFDQNPGDMDEMLRDFWSIRQSPERTFTDERAIPFALELIKGIATHRDEIDLIITQTLANYSIERLSAVDRNVIRLGAYEMRYTDAPAAIIINEAIEVARSFSGAESGKFVNGVLDRLRNALRPGEPASRPASKPDHIRNRREQPKGWQPKTYADFTPGEPQVADSAPAPTQEPEQI